MNGVEDMSIISALGWMKMAVSLHSNQGDIERVGNEGSGGTDSRG